MSVDGESRRPQRGPMTGPWKAALSLALVLLAVLIPDARALEPVPVDIRDSRYLPPTLTVPVGSTVRWTNRDEETHTVTSTTGRFGSPGLDLDETYTYTFTTPGMYPYTCDLHPIMGGMIVVQ